MEKSQNTIYREVLTSLMCTDPLSPSDSLSCICLMSRYRTFSSFVFFLTEIEFRADDYDEVKRGAGMCLATGETSSGARGSKTEEKVICSCESRIANFFL